MAKMLLANHSGFSIGSRSRLRSVLPVKTQLVQVRFFYDLVFRGEIEEEDLTFLGANNKQTIKQAKIIRIMEAV